MYYFLGSCLAANGACSSIQWDFLLQVLLRWNVQHGSCVIPKSGNSDRIKENAGIWGWTLDKKDFDAISSIKFQVRLLPTPSSSLTQIYSEAGILSSEYSGAQCSLGEVHVLKSFKCIVLDFLGHFQDELHTHHVSLQSWWILICRRGCAKASSSWSRAQLTQLRICGMERCNLYKVFTQLLCNNFKWIPAWKSQWKPDKGSFWYSLLTRNRNLCISLTNQKLLIIMNQNLGQYFQCLSARSIPSYLLTQDPINPNNLYIVYSVVILGVNLVAVGSNSFSFSLVAILW